MHANVKIINKKKRNNNTHTHMTMIVSENNFKELKSTRHEAYNTR